MTGEEVARRPWQAGRAGEVEREHSSTAGEVEAHGDRLTVVRSLSGVLTKKIAHGLDGWQVTPFSAGAWYSVFELPVSNMESAAAQLDRVARDARAAVVRGRPLLGIDRSHCRRLCNRVEHGNAVTFEAAPRRWLALDVDGVPEPDCLTFAAEPEEGVEHVLGLLPPPFAEASCWWQATSTAGIKPGIRARLWFWLSRPVGNAEAKGWVQGYPVDRSIFTPVALHYTAPPILAPGTPPPVARRSGTRRGLVDTVQVPAELPPVETYMAARIELDGLAPTQAELTKLRVALRRSRAARAIWTGQRPFEDRSSRHFALVLALAHAGLTDPDTLHRVLVEHDRRLGADLTKVMRADYARRTIGVALATANTQRAGA
jgi:hypothetical protein